MFEKRRKEIQTRREEIRALLTEAAEEELEKLECELDDLDGEEATIARREEAIGRINRSGQRGGHEDKGDGDGPVDPITGRVGISADADSRAARLAVLQGVTAQEAEERARTFVSGGHMEIITEALKRSLTLTSGNIAQPTRVSGINGRTEYRFRYCGHGARRGR